MIGSMRVLGTVLCVAATAGFGGAMAAEQALYANDEGQVVFVTPSGNIGCTYTPEGGTSVYETADGDAELICERVEPSYVTVILPASGKGKRIDNPGEQGCCSDDQALAYGGSASIGPFLCISRKTGLSCENEDGHGFLISKAKIKLH